MIDNITNYAASQAQTKKLAEIGKQALAEKQQEANANRMTKAYETGIQHGAEATARELYAGLAQQQPYMQDPYNQGGGVTAEEVQRAKQLFGTDKIDMRDIEYMRALNTLDESNRQAPNRTILNKGY